MTDNFNAVNDGKKFFAKALPVWTEGRADEPNSYMVLSCTLPAARGMKLYITGFTSYRVFAGGRFIHYGPARTAGGYARVDVLELPAEGGELVIDASGYRCFSLATVNQPSFVCAEVRGDDGSVISATGDSGFDAYAPASRVRKVMRFSRQRHYSEVWDYRDGVRFYSENEKVPVSVVDTVLTYLPRRAPYADMTVIPAKNCACAGKYVYNSEKEIKKAPYNDSETQTRFPDGWGGWPYDEIEYKPFWDVQRMETDPERTDVSFPLTLSEGEFASVCLDNVEAGFIGTDMTAAEGECDVIVAFNELCDPARYVIPRITCTNTVEYLIKPGERCNAVTAEPYTARVILVAVKKGRIRLDGVSVIAFRRDMSDFRRVKYDDPELDMIEEAALRSFAHNAVDIYMDCPSRERAGWLCDSYFTGQVEYLLTGSTQTEDAFIENFLIRDNARENLGNPYGRIMPDGMLPMCYPSDMSGSLFMPQWAMWFVLECDMYLNIRRPDAPEKTREGIKRTVLALCRYFEKFENGDGLLERLKGHQFIEWSAANKWGQDINYPTNFLYSEMLECAGRLLGMPQMKEKAELVRRVTVRKSFNGTFFADNAVYGDDGKAHNTENISEACQYYAVRFGHIDLNDEKYADLRNAVLTKFRPGRPRDLLPGVEPADALMGIYLRMELLCGGTDAEKAMIVDEIREYFGERASRTGTLWEYRDHKGSLDHGFASFVTVCLRKALGR